MTLTTNDVRVLRLLSDGEAWTGADVRYVLGTHRGCGPAAMRRLSSLHERKLLALTDDGQRWVYAITDAGREALAAAEAA